MRKLILMTVLTFIVSATYSQKLYKAVKKGKISKVEKLIKKGADVNEYTKKGGFPLAIAAYKNEFQICELLIKCGANVMQKYRIAPNYSTAIGVVIQTGNVDLLKLFIENGYDVNYKDNQGFTPLVFAILLKQPEMVAYLIANGAAVDSTSTDSVIMPKVEPLTFDNIYIADDNICKTKDLPITRFAVEYPDDCVIKPSNSSHITLQKKNNNFVIEEFSIGSASLTLKNKEFTMVIIEKLVDNFNKQIPDFEIVYIGKKDFNGKSTYLFEGKADFSAYKEQGYNGIYKMMILIPLPEKNSNINAVPIILLANEQSEIKQFSDFANKGMSGKIYNTFRYIE